MLCRLFNFITLRKSKPEKLNSNAEWNILRNRYDNVLHYQIPGFWSATADAVSIIITVATGKREMLQKNFFRHYSLQTKRPIRACPPFKTDLKNVFTNLSFTESAVFKRFFLHLSHLKHTKSNFAVFVFFFSLCTEVIIFLTWITNCKSASSAWNNRRKKSSAYERKKNGVIILPFIIWKEWWKTFSYSAEFDEMWRFFP